MIEPIDFVLLMEIQKQKRMYYVLQNNYTLFTNIEFNIDLFYPFMNMNNVTCELVTERFSSAPPHLFNVYKYIRCKYQWYRVPIEDTKNYCEDVSMVLIEPKIPGNIQHVRMLPSMHHYIRT